MLAASLVLVVMVLVVVVLVVALVLVLFVFVFSLRGCIVVSGFGSMTYYFLYGAIAIHFKLASDFIIFNRRSYNFTDILRLEII